ncbi:MAG: chromosome segregation protein SMC [Pelatocladus maniniholoensis HA4357-MV3]|jgi:chromosome segregation protein|uniref:Chromosome partition protein Smc n=1 Tax=Pelatocladus maniniholoensis HA4357-MV3 TaxID=1117104 RepID=A0A9E3H9Z1_9NOST|nr:chromosome segregation protein SMC [Pelatocladus maniniholoensis HA4357-MV3]
MVHIKRVELTNFKSFGGTTSVPLLSGFTVVSGPNGSGKSNILDSLLFCLGLSSSKGMRADRLPDLVNTTQTSKSRSAVEAIVTVTFDLLDHEPDEFLDMEPIVSTVEVDTFDDETPPVSPPYTGGTEGEVEPTEDERNRKQKIRAIAGGEWSVTRRLRVTPQGTYTSNYYINGISTTLTELHEELERLRVYPEGYNVVLQGDVTSIISMNARERREIIDELAGVASFDRKIKQAKNTLEEVREKEDSCRIIETELTTQCDRLSQDKAKAEKYQKLRTEYLEKQKWEAVLSWRTLQNHQEKLANQIQAGDRTSTELTEQLTHLNTHITQKNLELDQLNARVKALGEEELLAVQAILANQEAERKQLQRQQTELETASQETAKRLTQTQQEIQQHQQTIEQLVQQQNVETLHVTSLQQERDAVQQQLENSRQAAAEIASASEAWVQQQTALNRQIETLLQTVEPQRTEQAQLRERNNQLQQQIQEQTQLIQTVEPEIADKQSQISDVETLHVTSLQQIETLTPNLTATEQELQIQQETQKRLLQEQREKQRQLDKLEAQAQAQQEVQGTGASKVILQSGMSGICGLVVKLGRVEPRFQLALEISAGARLGHIVVENDAVAAAGIELLKQRRAGRATFLPLNKIQAPRFTHDATLRLAQGFIGYAVNLVECAPRYRDVFAYVFGNTVVFSTLEHARKNLGLYRIVTLEGELLETSGAMTGGSVFQRSALRFGSGEAGDHVETLHVTSLRKRLEDIERILERCTEAIASLATRTKQLSQELTEARQTRREQQLQLEQLQKEIKTLTSQLETTRSQLSQNTEKLTSAQSRLEVLDRELPDQEQQLQQLRHALTELEASQTPQEWQQIQAVIKEQEQQLQQRDQVLRSAEQNLKDLENRQQRLQEKIQESEQRIIEYQRQETSCRDTKFRVSNEITTTDEQISQTRQRLSEMEANLGEEKQKRDRTEQELRGDTQRQQQLEWEIQKLQETQQTRREELANLQAQLQTVVADLPSPLPEVPDKVDLEELQKELRSLAKRLQAMEPVNMLALEQYERTQKRLEELSQKLQTLEAERTELLLRIENFTTLRQRAFKEAFDAVNENFKSIFATLSEGDGYLQLDNPEDPFISGLNLVAHPKGKPVQRLASMSGGEKSLTALSFIFALQRYRPSPFYAFDEVDMFLDGANVERLAKMIKQQAQQAQFIVVSLRRPMIESAERTIGVTQARGAFTQVLGIKLQSSNTSA